ncbi:hypothetical protein DIPPA_26819 [Diplonema papillatum]|nr:hypothetical protein DIPPA_26819 [Diplonema papillatum]
MRLSNGAPPLLAQAGRRSFAYTFHEDVSKRPRREELRRAWHAMPKYFVAPPPDAYQHKWMPTISPSGQDVEVDPYDRIAKRGSYPDMLENWEPWYNLQNLLESRGAPKEVLKIAQDLGRRNIALADGYTSSLMWHAVREVEAAIKLGSSVKTRNKATDAAGLIRVLERCHTVGLRTGAAMATLYGLGGQYEKAEALEVNLRHLLEDPEEDIAGKREFYESLSLAALPQARDAGKALGWQATMFRKHLRPSAGYWKKLLFHLTANGEFTRVQETRQNMKARLIVPAPAHYFYFLKAAADSGSPALYTQLQLEMKQERIPHSTRSAWDGYLLAYANAGDVVGLLNAWDRVKRGVALLKGKPGRNLRSRGTYVPTAAVPYHIVKALRAKGHALEAYTWWRAEFLQAGAWAAKHWRPRAVQKMAFATHLLIELADGLLHDAARPDLAAELYDEVYPKTLPRPEPDAMLQRVRDTWKPRLFVTSAKLWYLFSEALCHRSVGRLPESHFCLTLAPRVTVDTVAYSSQLFTPLLEACHVRALLEPDAPRPPRDQVYIPADPSAIDAGSLNTLPRWQTRVDDRAAPIPAAHLFNSTIALLNQQKRKLTGDCYALVLRRLVAGGGEAATSLLRVYSELKAQRVFPDGQAPRLVRELDPGDAHHRALAKGLWRDSWLARRRTGGFCRAVVERLSAGAGSDAQAALAAFRRDFEGADAGLLLGTHGFEGLSPGAVARISAGASLLAGGQLRIGARSRWGLDEAKPTVFVADGTVAHHLHLLPAGARVLLLQGVLCQLHDARENPRAAAREKQYFSSSLAAFRDALLGDGGDEQLPEGSLPAPDVDLSLVELSAELAIYPAGGPERQAPVSARVVGFAKWLAGAEPGSDVVLATNDVQLSLKARRDGVTTLVLNQHAAAQQLKLVGSSDQRLLADRV